jgi:hypothetical protein
VTSADELGLLIRLDELELKLELKALDCELLTLELLDVDEDESPPHAARINIEEKIENVNIFFGAILFFTETQLFFIATLPFFRRPICKKLEELYRCQMTVR